MAANDETDSGIDNGDGFDQCIVWYCSEARSTRWGKKRVAISPLHCRAHQGFAHVDQEADNGS